MVAPASGFNASGTGQKAPPNTTALAADNSGSTSQLAQGLLGRSIDNPGSTLPIHPPDDGNGGNINATG